MVPKNGLYPIPFAIDFSNNGPDPTTFDVVVDALSLLSKATSIPTCNATEGSLSQPFVVNKDIGRDLGNKMLEDYINSGKDYKEINGA